MLNNWNSTSNKRKRPENRVYTRRCKECENLYKTISRTSKKCLNCYVMPAKAKKEREKMKLILA